MRALLDVGQASSIPQLIDGDNTRLTLSIIAQAAAAKDPVALDALAETGRAVGMGVANLINIFNPEMIVIGGPLSIFSEYLLPAINEVVERQAMVESRQQTQVVVSAFGPTTLVMGAASLVVSAVLVNPNHLEQVGVIY